jgi:hypothetical protein
VPWVESRSPCFTARHDAADTDDATSVLELLEGTRERLSQVFERVPGEVAVVMHDSTLQLALARPLLPAVWLLTAPAARRYLAGGASTTELHVLRPRRLAQRASNVAGSLEMLMLSPAALYAQLVVALNNPGLPPPLRPARLAHYARWAWLTAGAAQYFSGQTAYARSPIARRLREGRRPAFPPAPRDATLLGGSVLDLLADEQSEESAVAFASRLAPGGPQAALRRAFGRPLAEIDARWREHLDRLAAP